MTTLIVQFGKSSYNIWLDIGNQLGWIILTTYFETSKTFNLWGREACVVVWWNMEIILFTFPPSLIQLLIINMAVLFRSILPHYQSEHHKYTQIHGIMTYCLFALHRPTSLNTEKIRWHLYLFTNWKHQYDRSILDF